MSRENSMDDLAELDNMLLDLENGPSVFHPAPFWSQLNNVHRHQLEKWGFDNFKRTINTKYFNWRILGILRHQLGIVGDWFRHPRLQILRAGFPDPSFRAGPTIASFNAPSAWIYKTFVALYAELIRRQDTLGLLDRLQEPSLGHPFTISYLGKDLSQDLCNSIHEFYSMFGFDLEVVTGAPLAVAEIGAGYGRLAYVILSETPNSSYTIIDVPPALYLSQRYLTSVLPDVTAFRYRPWTDYQTIADDFEAARVRFLLPHQAEQLPDKSVDVFINVSTLHEMTQPQVQRYFQLMDRLCRGRIYTKQWVRSRAGVNGVVFGQHDYPVPARWRTIFHRRHPVQRMFFEALYDAS